MSSPPLSHLADLARASSRNAGLVDDETAKAFQDAASPSVVLELVERVRELEAKKFEYDSHEQASAAREFVETANVMTHMWHVPLQVDGRQLRLYERIDLIRKEAAARIAELESGLREACEAWEGWVTSGERWDPRETDRIIALRALTTPSR